jgi:hypothetical protein
MIKSLATMLLRKLADPPPEEHPVRVMPYVPFEARPVIKDEHTPIYESLTMTEELREALFPTTPRMVSTIFERSGDSASNPPPPAAPPAPLAREAARLQDGGSYPII